MLSSIYFFLICLPIHFVFSYSSFFNHWICVGIKEEIKWDKPYKINIGELPLVLWKDGKKNEIHASLNICKHMGSKLDNGLITDQGCLKCRYHGLEYSNLDQFGEVVEQDGKIFWSYKPTSTSPFKIPFFNNPKYEKSFLTIDMDASLTDSAFNTMDLRHPEYVHGGIGFGSSIPPENIKEFVYNDEKVGLSFDYNANKIFKKINKNSVITKNFHMFYYPTFSWSKVTFGKNNNLIIGVNLLPISKKKTRWYITIVHNYYTNDIQKQIMKIFALLILGQDYIQMKNQQMENKLKKYILFNYVFKNEETIIRLKDMFKKYDYPTDDICLEVYKDYKTYSFLEKEKE
jgi:nitrite reductase/ring-hydroxylating ferredoxin subunit